MTTATALYISNPLTLNGGEKVPLDKSDGASTGACLSQAIADLYKGTKGANLASAATVTLANATGNVVHITGTTTITSFDNATAGLVRIVIFDGALLLTHNATSLILPTGANITTAAGDTAVMFCDTTNNWRCLSFQRKDGTAVGGATIVDGSVTLAKLSTTAKTVPIQIACSDLTSALTSGTSKGVFRMPYAYTLTGVRASLATAQTSGSTFTVDINEGGTTILSTKLTIDNTEKTSTTAATPAVISDTSLADDAEITVDIDAVGDGTAKGLVVTLIGYPT